ncbi:MAG TPA: efflux RND transporter periplasmic adaptor subunit [Bryobacteraceae bacterium]|nr:efflux RND transporter periplasmic adaptor subunit [Bryobacteraceae bacterium]
MNQLTNNEPETAMKSEMLDPAPRRGMSIGLIATLLVAFAAIGWFVYKGIYTRVSAEKALVVQTHDAAVLTVSVTHPKLTNATQELVLPGNTQPLIDSPIYARTNGYLKKWYFDIGAHVKAGQLLAEIETPEVDHQLQQARADLETAQTNFNLAKITADRMVNLEKKGAVARQDTDNVVGDMNAKKATVDSNAANVKRLEDLQSYEKVYAPFDGIITARNTDIGALINAGAANQLFHISATNQLRVYISVPEDYEQAARNGAPATLTLNEFPGRSFPGTVVRNSSAIDLASRTLLVEVDADNPTGELLPGAYVSVHLKYTGAAGNALTIPVTTVMFRSEGIRAAVVRGGKAMLLPITIGRDFGDSLEVLAGLRPNDQLILNPPDSLISGTPVKVEETAK